MLYAGNQSIDFIDEYVMEVLFASAGFTLMWMAE